MRKVRAKAPLRLGLAGGGTDVSPYSDEFGGCVLNATINMYAYTTLTELSDDHCTFSALDLDIEERSSVTEIPACDQSNLALHRMTYLRVMKDFNAGICLPVAVKTYCDAPAGSGLGSSSTLVVSMLQAYKALLDLPLGEYDIARLAFQIEREDCGLSGGRQDQYAAAFGGFNFMEFAGDSVIVNPLRIRRHIVNELEASMLLFFTGKSRDSAKIIQDQKRALKSSATSRLEAMHEIKRSAVVSKELLLRGDIEGLAMEMKNSWLSKKATSNSISNEFLDEVESRAMEAGALSLKISGAGGGGFMIMFVEPEHRVKVEHKLSDLNGRFVPFQFSDHGVMTWTI
jgi:D-glycero-alpha-D-manno-heptose-7-phosphate kinase